MFAYIQVVVAYTFKDICEYKTSLDYKMGSRTAWNPVLKQTPGGVEGRRGERTGIGM